MAKKKENVYLLYTNEEQEKLLAAAYSVDHLKEVTQYYTGGTWFEYDAVGDRSIVNERLFSEKVKFPKKAKPIENYDPENTNMKWI